MKINVQLSPAVFVPVQLRVTGFTAVRRLCGVETGRETFTRRRDAESFIRFGDSRSTIRPEYESIEAAKARTYKRLDTKYQDN